MKRLFALAALAYTLTIVGCSNAVSNGSSGVGATDTTSGNGNPAGGSTPPAVIPAGRARAGRTSDDLLDLVADACRIERRRQLDGLGRSGRDVERGLGLVGGTHEARDADRVGLRCYRCSGQRLADDDGEGDSKRGPVARV